MRKIIILSIFLFLVSCSFGERSLNSLAKDIGFKCNDIQVNLTSYEPFTVDVWGLSTEGGQATVYSDSLGIKFIQEVYYGETGKIVFEYYFNDEHLIFIFDQGFTYNRPIYWDKKLAKENNDSEIFDSDKSTIAINKYYFNNDKLFLWLDNDEQKVDLTLNENISKGEELVANCYKKIKELER